MGYKEDRIWSDGFTTVIKRNLGEAVIRVAPNEDDLERNTDFIVFDLYGKRIACRIRKNSDLKWYHNQFTIRTARPSGVRTELDKIMEGLGDYLFYGFSNYDETDLVQWILGDLNVFRNYIFQYMKNNHGELPGILKRNDDGTMFRAFYYRDIPDFIKESRMDQPR